MEEPGNVLCTRIPIINHLCVKVVWVYSVLWINELVLDSVIIIMQSTNHLSGYIIMIEPQHTSQSETALVYKHILAVCRQHMEVCTA